MVWNPWQEKARRLADFGDEEYHRILCGDTANAAQDAVTLAPGDPRRLTVILSSRPA